MEKAIDIDVCRVSRYDGHLWLDLMFSIPLGYECTNIQVTPVFMQPEIPALSKEYLTAAAGIIAGPDEYNSVSLKIDEEWGVGIDTYGMYTVFIECRLSEEAQTQHLDMPYIIEETLTISDIEFVYYCTLPALTNLCDKCAPLPDSILRQYLMMWGHETAMRNKDIATAEYLYKKMLNCGNPCQKTAPLDCGCSHG